MDSIAVLIPCYNEEKTVAQVIDSFRAVLPDAKIYVYDNASNDDTAKIAIAHGAIVRYERQRGKGSVVRRMFREIDAECYIMVDGDSTYPAEDASEMSKFILSHQADMVIGDRLNSTYHDENDRPLHSAGNTLVCKLVNGLFHGDVADIMTGYRAFSYAFVKTFPVLSRGFEIETEMTIHALDNNLSIKSILVEYRDRPQGSVSKLNTFHDGYRVLKTIGSLCKNYRPLLFFGIIALLLVVPSLLFFISVLLEYSQTGLVPRFPTLLVSGFLMIAAIQCYMSGLTLENECKKHRQSFEMQWNLMLTLQKYMLKPCDTDMPHDYSETANE